MVRERKCERNQYDFSVAHLAELKCDGQRSKRKRILQHVPGTLNIPADAFSRLVEKAEATVHHIMVLGCTETQRQLITECHEWLCAHNGVDRKLAILTQRHLRDTEADAWPNL